MVRVRVRVRLCRTLSADIPCLGGHSQDWRVESSMLANGSQILEFDAFFMSMFNFIDTWTFTAAVQEDPGTDPYPNPHPVTDPSFISGG